MIPAITKGAAEALQLGKNGSYSNEGNILQHVLYDNQLFQNTALRATTTFFSIGIGGAYGGGVKSIIETNLQDQGKLPNGQTFLIKEISFAFLATALGADVDANTILADYYNILQHSTIEIKIAGREFDLQVPGTCFLNPVQLAALNSAANGVSDTGNFISTGWLKLSSTPIPIGQLVSFSVIQRSGSAIAAKLAILDTASDELDTQVAEMQCRLRGILTRAI